MWFVDDSELRFSEEMETKRPVIQIIVSFYSWTSETWFSFCTHPLIGIHTYTA